MSLKTFITQKYVHIISYFMLDILGEREECPLCDSNLETKKRKGEYKTLFNVHLGFCWPEWRDSLLQDSLRI